MNWRKLLIGTWSWKRPLYSLASIYLLLGIVAFFFTDRFLFQPPPILYSPEDPGIVLIEGAGGARIAAIWHPPAKGMPVLLYSHGNAEDIGDNRPAFEAWAAMGIGVLGYDYPGYGLSEGSPSEEGANAAARAAWDWLAAQGVPPGSITLVGRSVGGGPALWLDSQVDAAAVVLISPFTSVYRVAFRCAPFPRDRFPNLDRIRESRTPLLVIHGKRDEVIPFRHGETLYHASPAETKRLLPISDAAHNDLFDVAFAEIIAETAAFARANSTP